MKTKTKTLKHKRHTAPQMTTRTAVINGGEIISSTPWKPVDPTVPPVPAAPLRLDLGCGPNKKAGFTGCDSIAFPGVDVVTDLRQAWPWPDNSADEIHASHVIEHFDATERVHVYNEMWRVMKPGAKATLIAPYWSSGRAYGDPTHKWPPICSFGFYYLLKDWRSKNAPHTDFANWPLGYKCDFDVTWGFNLHPEVATRNQEYIQFAMNFYTESCQDVIATLVAKK